MKRSERRRQRTLKTTGRRQEPLESDDVKTKLLIAGCVQLNDGSGGTGALKALLYEGIGRTTRNE